MPNQTSFDEFLKTLKQTNRELDFFVDWKKCIKNRDKISLYLNSLNFLLGKENLLECIGILYKESPNCFKVLPILLAIRDKKEIVLDNDNLLEISNFLKTTKDIYYFICKSGLDEIFRSKTIKDLNDFVFGIEVGLDSNARKNRGGKKFETQIANIFKENNLNFKEQVKIKELFGYDEKVFDFIIFSDVNYLIECNFYTSGGSKLNEVARSFQELNEKIKNNKNYKFIWITDGIGWLGAKNKLQEAYKKVEIYNLTNIDNFIKKIKK